MNYWLSPKGKVWAEQNIGQHRERAKKIIDEYFYHEVISDEIDPVDFLESKGFIRFMDWGNKPQWIIYNQKPTHHQIKKMFELTSFIFEY
jgi:hypothetical protein